MICLQENCTNKAKIKFCSRSCAAKFNNKKFPKRTNGRTKPKCAFCKAELALYDRKFCNGICQGEFYFLLKIEEIKHGKCNSPSTLKKWLKREHGDKCSNCEQEPIWHDNPLMMQLDHIDGNSDNNKPENLRLLCPNCHSQTETFSGKCGKKNTKRNRYLRKFKGYEGD